MYNSTMIKCKTLWKIIEEAGGLKSAVFGYLMSWPPHPINGFMLTDRIYEKKTVYPEFRQKAVSRITDKPFHYQRTNSGYLLYSLGPNQRDDRRKTVRSQPPGDDIAVRMNLKK